MIGFSAYYFYLKISTNNLKDLIQSHQFQNGDLIFQTSTSSQSKAIQLATKSKFSHCGLIFEDKNDYYVFEAIQPVQKTPLIKWIQRGENQKYEVKRLIDSKSILNSNILEQMGNLAKKYYGKDYDLKFEWTDDKIYCSELIWKLYYISAGIKLCELETLSDFDFSSQIVQSKIKQRYDSNLPKNQQFISPSAINKSSKLELVYSNY